MDETTAINQGWAPIDPTAPTVLQLGGGASVRWVTDAERVENPEADRVVEGPLGRVIMMRGDQRPVEVVADLVRS